ncbi:MAG: translation initiation factor IF-3, partial [Planctomycetota bacterium]
EVIRKFTDALDDIAKVERNPLFEGRRMTCIITKR